MRDAALLVLRVIGLALVLFLSRMVGSLLAGDSSNSAAVRPEQAGAVIQGLLLVSVLHAGVLAYLIRRALWRGWLLVVTLFWTLFGITTLLPLIEAVVFLPHVLPLATVLRLVVSGAIMAGLFCPLAVLIMGRMKRQEETLGGSVRLVMPAAEWAWKLAVVSATYVFLYLLFGYVIAWQDPAVRAFYATIRMPSFGELVLLQIFRALLWTSVAVPVIRMIQGSWQQAALMVGVLFGVLMGALLLVPSPYMPDAVRSIHLVEVTTSNLLFGWLLVWVLTCNRQTSRDRVSAMSA